MVRFSTLQTSLRSFVSCCGDFRFGNGEVGNGRGKAPGEAREVGAGGVNQDDAMALGAGGRV